MIHDSRFMIQDRMDYSLAQFKKTIIMLGIRTGAIMAIAAGLIWFLNLEISKESKALYDESTVRQIVNGKREKFTELEKEFKAVKDDKINMEAVVPSEANIFEVMRLFESLAKKSGGSASVSFSDSLNKDGVFIETPFHFTAFGNIDFFEKYLKALEDLPYGIKFASANIAGSTGLYNNGEMKLEASMIFSPE